MRRKRKHTSRTQLIIAAITIAALVTAFAFMKPSQKSQMEEEDMPVYLNEVITNSLSEIQELEGLDRKVRKFLTRWQIKAASLAVTRNDSLLYAKGYG